MYSRVLKPILFLFPPEDVHDFFVFSGELLGKFRITQWLISTVYGYKGRGVAKIVDGIHYATPCLLSAGFDYNARLTHILPFIGFGGVEVGSVTARPCSGNPKPRLTRLPLSQSILVNKGLKNEGVDAIIKRLQSRKQEKNFVVGVSIARTNDAKNASVEEGIQDYCYSFKRLNEESVGDYYTINISCPNAFGGETFAVPQLLDRLLFALSKIPCTKPVYVKMPINITTHELYTLIDIVCRYKLQGIVVGNLQKNYDKLIVRAEAPHEYAGGLSGKPCFHDSNMLIAHARKKYGNRITIIGCGGILTPKDALKKHELGSDLIQYITGLVYSGPSLTKKICTTFAEAHQ